MKLPPDIRVLERGWLSSNNVLLLGADNAALVDSGYATHSAQTVALVGQALGGRRLDRLLNTHLHSDHCGGNAALQARFPGLQTMIPPGQAEAVRQWDEAVLSYAPTGQTCPRFAFDDLLRPGREIKLGARHWQIHAAPGHDPHSVILFEPNQRILISADALWANGFGVVFPELEGQHAFAEVGATLDLIESLQPDLVIPGHGAPFAQVEEALSRARQRLAQFVADPARHARHAAKVLIKFKLLEWQRIERSAFERWVTQTSYFATLHHAHFATQDHDAWLSALLRELIEAGALQIEHDAGTALLLNA